MSGRKKRRLDGSSEEDEVDLDDDDEIDEEDDEIDADDAYEEDYDDDDEVDVDEEGDEEQAEEQEEATRKRSRRAASASKAKAKPAPSHGRSTRTASRHGVADVLSATEAEQLLSAAEGVSLAPKKKKAKPKAQRERHRRVRHEKLEAEHAAVVRALLGTNSAGGDGDAEDGAPKRRRRGRAPKEKRDVRQQRASRERRHLYELVPCVRHESTRRGARVLLPVAFSDHLPPFLAQPSPPPLPPRVQCAAPRCSRPRAGLLPPPHDATPYCGALECYKVLLKKA